MEFDREKMKADLRITLLACNKKKELGGGLKFFLVGAILADIEWTDGTKEKVELMGRVHIEPFSAGKALLGKWLSLKIFNSKLKGQYVEDLITEIINGINKIIEAKKLGDKEFKELRIC